MTRIKNTSEKSQDFNKQEIAFPRNADDYKIDLLIGSGAFANVYTGVCIPFGARVAIKVRELEQNGEINIEDIIKETEIMKSLNHRNVLHIYTSFVNKKELWLILPFCENGSCDSIIKYCPRFNNGFKDELVLVTILFDVLNAIEYCHSNHRIHRDIKGANILLTKDGVAKLADFGVSESLISSGTRITKVKALTGSPCWMAPELFHKEGYNHKVDIWSFGITALELGFGKPPQCDSSKLRIMEALHEKPPPSVDSMGNNRFSRQFKSFVSKCLIKDKNSRWSAKQLLKHSFFKQSKIYHKYIVDNVIIYSKPIIQKRFKRKQPNSQVASSNMNSCSLDLKSSLGHPYNN